MNDRNVVLIHSSEIIDVVRRSLSKIDPRLVSHGERVAYIAQKIHQSSVAPGELDPSKLFVLCVLHDIGAYKTNEIDEMVRFETERPLEHSLYGYLFLKNTSHLSEYAEALLYHHTDYAELRHKNCPYERYARLIYLADRIDILLQSGRNDLTVFRSMAGTRFCVEDLEAMFRAEERDGFSQKLICGDYRWELAQMLNSLRIPDREIMDYLKLLVYAIDFRSPYTVTHTADTTAISVEVGRLMGIQEKNPLYLGAFLHDIGKIAIPYAVLEKPTGLNKEEFSVIQRHIQEGEEILRGVVSDEICDIALRHHEKLDGTGYARGLTGDQLTLPQRIVAVSDILSALSQRRSYKEPFPKERVIGILQEMKDGGKLCPRVVDTVCGQYDQIIEKTEREHNPVRQMYENLLEEYALMFGELEERKGQGKAKKIIPGN